MEIRIRIVVTACSVLLLLGAHARAEVLSPRVRRPSRRAAMSLGMCADHAWTFRRSDRAETYGGSPLATRAQDHIAHNNAKLDPWAVKVIYEKQTPIDLTDRLRKYLSGDGIDMPDAEVPPGTHLLRVELKDNLGRTSVSEVRLLVQ